MTIQSGIRAGRDSLFVQVRCDTCPEGSAPRRDLYRRSGNRIEWLGYDLREAPGAWTGQVRWPQPLPLLDLPPRPGATLDAAPQTAGDGTRLLGWRARCAGTDSPYELVPVSGIPGLP